MLKYLQLLTRVSPIFRVLQSRQKDELVSITKNRGTRVSHRCAATNRQAAIESISIVSNMLKSKITVCHLCGGRYNYDPLCGVVKGFPDVAIVRSIIVLCRRRKSLIHVRNQGIHSEENRDLTYSIRLESLVLKSTSHRAAK